MTEQIELIITHEWGLEVVLKAGVIIDDNNVLQVIHSKLDMCRQHGKHKVLLDASKIIRQVSMLRFIEVAELMQREIPGLRAAFYAPHLADKEQSKSMETFSINRGVNLHYFNDKSDAIAWLSH
jgi:hypothetical protein